MIRSSGLKKIKQREGVYYENKSSMDNVITWKPFRPVKVEEVYLVSHYPDEKSAWEEIGL